jgi:hypothetical protein
MTDLQLDPHLLRACASYLVNSSTYRASPEEMMALLREDARGALAQFGWHEPDGLGGRPPDDQVDEFTRSHLAALTSFGTTRRAGQAPGVCETAQAFLDATPGMVVWWLEKLGAPMSEPAIRRWLGGER